MEYRFVGLLHTTKSIITKYIYNNYYKVGVNEFGDVHFHKNGLAAGIPSNGSRSLANLSVLLCTMQKVT